MKRSKSLNYAYRAALKSWVNEYDKLGKDPTNSITKANESRLWKEVKELNGLMIIEKRRKK